MVIMRGDLDKNRFGGKKIFIVPGLCDSSSAHWQSLWEQAYPDWERVRQKNWISPNRDDWMAALQKAIAGSSAPVILVGHSLGCCLIAHWACHHSGSVHGALLVAPPDVDAPTFPASVENFSPVPLLPLPFPSIVVASIDDPFCSLARTQYFARKWGSRLEVLGRFGHINDQSGLGAWSAGVDFVSELASRC